VILRVRDLRWGLVERRGWGGSPDEHVVLRGVDLTVARGEIVGLVGANGAGKTSLGLAALRLLDGVRGRVLWGENDVSDWPERRLRPLRRRYQGLLQSPYSLLSPFMTGSEHLDETVRDVLRAPAPGPADWRPLVEELGIGALLGSPVHSISSGEARRLSLARVLLCRPSFLFADEPDAGLDPPARVALVRRLRRLAADGTGILLVTHDRAALRRASDRIMVLDGGALHDAREEVAR
jgi:ABC-type multidrug transport system ATPase subunit